MGICRYTYYLTHCVQKIGHNTWQRQYFQKCLELQPIDDSHPQTYNNLHGIPAAKGTVELV